MQLFTSESKKEIVIQNSDQERNVIHCPTYVNQTHIVNGESFSI